MRRSQCFVVRMLGVVMAAGPEAQCESGVPGWLKGGMTNVKLNGNYYPGYLNLCL